ncbi:MAG: 23S rRNA (guanosine(2251)-2'-O)-methyltransferase RlmB [Rhodospirillaceae bacterium]|jgi:23S rRNA (guanosine2251-2'-O)-methyltransferase|nr:23S rRNA (guanosine(2251)-2'-O)-methyltransferase RlmB [Rhodospirillaceae bacterium]MBT5939251.1 23S rRNA (guanosine(2251)-2'-O)-methyltransferase RlmB [Rhodospirillaceae bacterium]MBT7265499.1 23S rRNA (guanosine(2251)-2'-O)-methyltransferase RlmB [Rhodospirillaceae bacterium]
MAKRKKSPRNQTRGNSARNSSSQSNRNRAKASGSGLGPNGQIWLYGNHAVEAALANPKRKKYRLLVNEEFSGTYEIGESEVQPEFVDRQDIERLLPADAVHQGMALLVAPLDYEAIETICAEATDPSIVIVLDQVTDPRNIGAIMRSATAFGATAIVVPDKHTPEATPALAKAASGALDRLPMVRVTNLTRALGQLKEAGFWTIGLDANAEQTLAQANLSGKLAVIMGAEGKGLRRLTSENCDYLVNIPIDPTADSLNVSAAAAITLYEIVRNRA